MRISYIELLGQKHPMCFSLAASERVDEEFGGLEAFLAEVQSEDTLRITRAADKMISILMAAGRTYVAALGDELPPPIPCRPADLIGVGDKETIRAIFSTVREDTGREVEVESKNAPATQGR